MTEQEWRAQSGPLYTRLIILDGKAENDGWTEEEREEHERLTAQTGRLLYEFLKSRTSKTK